MSEVLNKMTLAQRKMLDDPLLLKAFAENPDLAVQAEKGKFEKMVPKVRYKPPTMVRKARKVGRNDPCPCGSGVKFKKCHERLSLEIESASIANIQEDLLKDHG